MQLYQILKEELKTENNFVTDDGELKKWVVINKAQNYDAQLIAMLLRNETLKSKFFMEIETALVFNQKLFLDFLEQKNYLNDSYTKYKNKIGLTIDNKFLKQRNEVALVWPFKDCVLEGGQSKEEQKRSEIFFNEILAQDEITELTAPKVLTNAKVYTQNGEQAFETFERNAEINKARGLAENTITDNLIIKGNNLLALHSLKKEFEGKVKLIYIDPPYYFIKKSKNVDSFTYNSNFKLSTWLTFMRNRLILANDLLHSEGVIFISIDDGGQAYLNIILNEIFGSENFIANLPTIMNLKGNNDEFGFAGTHEYTLVYAKNKNKATINEFNINDEKIKTEWKEDEIGPYKKGANLKATGTNAPRIKRPNLFYPIFIDSDNKIYVSDNDTKQNDNDIILLPITDGKEMSWRWQKKKVKNEIYNIILSEKNGNYSLYKKQRPKLGELPTKKPKTIFYKPEYSSGNGTAQLKKIFGKKVLSNPKPIELIKDFILLGSSQDDIVLDFFAGSGTTAHAVLDLNKNTSSKRQFILIEQMNYIQNITKERIFKAIKGGGKFTYLELKKYNETFVEQIQSATDSDTLLSVWEEMKAKSFLNYNIDIQKQEAHIAEFKALEFSEQQKILLEMLDKNQLYVNYSSLEDADFACSEAEKQVTKAFYASL